jgi:hypothetical protein
MFTPLTRGEGCGVRAKRALCVGRAGACVRGCAGAVRGAREGVSG